MRETRLARRARLPIATSLMAVTLAVLTVPASAAPPASGGRGRPIPEAADPNECDYEGTNGDDVIVVFRGSYGGDGNIEAVLVNGEEQQRNPDAPDDDGEITVCGRGGRDTIIVEGDNLYESEICINGCTESAVIDVYGSGGNDLFCTRNGYTENIHGGDGSRDTAYIDPWDGVTKSVERVFETSEEPEACQTFNGSAT